MHPPTAAPGWTRPAPSDPGTRVGFSRSTLRAVEKRQRRYSSRASFGLYAIMSARTPLTNGLAIDVPDPRPYPAMTWAPEAE